MDLPSEWPSLKVPIDTWFRDVPYVQSGSEDRVEKRIEVEYEAEGLYPSVVDENIYVMLKSDYGNSHNSSDAGVYLVRTLKVR